MMLNWHLHLELHFLHYDGKFMQIRYHKGAGTKMHKCLTINTITVGKNILTMNDGRPCFFLEKYMR